MLASVSVELGIRIATDVLFEDDTLKDRIAIPDEDIVDLLDFCLSATNFKYNNPFYQHIFVSAMGSPVAAVMSNQVMKNLEQHPLSTSLVQPWY